jgi:hypothetical protein
MSFPSRCKIHATSTHQGDISLVSLEMAEIVAGVLSYFSTLCIVILATAVKYFGQQFFPDALFVPLSGDCHLDV